MSPDRTAARAYLAKLYTDHPQLFYDSPNVDRDDPILNAMVKEGVLKNHGVDMADTFVSWVDVDVVAVIDDILSGEYAAAFEAFEAGVLDADHTLKAAFDAVAAHQAHAAAIAAEVAAMEEAAKKAATKAQREEAFRKARYEKITRTWVSVGYDEDVAQHMANECLDDMFAKYSTYGPSPFEKEEAKEAKALAARSLPPDPSLPPPDSVGCTPAGLPLSGLAAESLPLPVVESGDKIRCDCGRVSRVPITLSPGKAAVCGACQTVLRRGPRRGGVVQDFVRPVAFFGLVIAVLHLLGIFAQ